MRRLIKGLMVGFATGLIGVLLALSPLYTPFERSVGLPWLFHVRGVIEPPSEVVVVAIDGRTGEQLGLPELPREWPRTIHAELIDSLARKGASVIVFDMDFKRSRNAEHDQAMADAMARAGGVVLFEHLDGKRQPVVDQQGRHQGSIWVEELEPPLPVLAEAARGLGPFPLPKLQASVHQFWVFKSSAREAPTMPVVALQVHALGAYPQWLEMLEASGARDLELLPRSAGNIRSPGELRSLMLDLRKRFEQDPQFAARMISAETGAPGGGQAVTRTSGSLLNALSRLYAGHNSRFLNFYGPPGTIATLPYQAVIKGEDPNIRPEALNLTGKVAFVGFSDLFDPGQPDRFYTVFTREDGVDLSGVEIAATAFSNLLTDRSLNSPDGWTTLAGLLLFGLFMGAMVYLLPAIAGVPLAISLAALYAIGAQMSFNQADAWLPLATPLLVQFPIALFAGLLGQYLLERHKVKHISEAISYYIPENVSRDLTAKTFDPNSLNKVVYSTCLATDMSGFSTLAEKMAPGELAVFLNDYFDSLAQPLKSHGVDVTEFRADAIMCAWTGGRSETRVRKNPILASLEAAEAIGKFKERNDMFDAKLRIGLEAGEVYVGHAGGGGHFVYSIVGDCANTASRIEGLNKHMGTQILTTPPVVEGFDDLLTRELGFFRFVGKSEAQPIVEILVENRHASPGQIALCERFAEAYAILLKAQWDRAVTGFEVLLNEYPDDGPTRFYLSLCRGYQKGESLPDDPNVVNMTVK